MLVVFVNRITVIWVKFNKIHFKGRQPEYITTYIYKVSYSVTDLRDGARNTPLHPPPPDQNAVFGKIGQIIGWYPNQGLAHPFWEIMDSPLLFTLD